MSATASRGQITVQVLLGIAALIGAIAAPVVWTNDIQAASEKADAVQDVKLATLQENYNDLKSDNKVLNQKIDILLMRAGVDPTKINSKL